MAVVRLCLLRLAVLVAVFSPAALAGRAGIGRYVGGQAHLAEQAGPLSLTATLDLLQNLPPSFLGLVAVATLTFMFVDQVLTAGALIVLDPQRPIPSRTRVLRILWDEASSHFWPFIRVLLLGLVVVALGNVAIIRVFDALGERAAVGGSNAIVRFVYLLGGQALVTAIWVAFVGGLTFWCRVLTVADQRTRVRRTAVLALRVLKRRPLRGPLLFAGVTLAVQVVGLLVLLAISPPSTPPIRWSAILLFLVLQVFMWQGLIRQARDLCLDSGIQEIREVADEPYRWFSRAWVWVRHSRMSATRVG